MQRDGYTGIHGNRVEYLCRHLGLLCNLRSRERTLLRVAANLHDLGKIGIADEVLSTSRIISLADSYDAMTTARPYHAARSHEETMEIMRSESGTKSDPVLFGYFVEIMTTIAGSPGWSMASFKPTSHHYVSGMAG